MIEPIKGRMYCYWSQGVNEGRASIKFCRLLSFDEKFAIVDRLDLTVNKRQTVEIKRLKEVQKRVKQERLPSL